MRWLQFHDNMIEQQLARHGLKLGDICYILHTHLHIDHAEQDDKFPMNTTVVLNRREMEFSVSGIMFPQYRKPDIKHLVDRIYEPEAIRFLDLDITTAEEIIPGIRCAYAGAHTEGSMKVVVETAEGLACICGDVIYDFNDQVVNHIYTNNWMEPRVTGNHSQSKREEKGAIKKLLNNYTFLLPIHDKPAKIERQKVVGRLAMQVPGPLTETLPDRPWFPV
ncbi:MBL fold metallo-hydrolase [Actibacterium sp. 188UL27-1]|uniref:MBL fold metallo-hydrolase n=1 Tax=Actibacterium sp. 188UL27-1 TaxID=2786961 RepID=UPI001EF6F893|nr:MBL fold metallo-hydrolase [Actibacterium sp. 188UL27-1]